MLQRFRVYGHQTHFIGPILNSMIEFLNNSYDGSQIRAQWVVDWACSPRYSASSQYVRLTTARGFLRYLRTTHEEIELPSTKWIARPRRPAPYIFSDDQLVQLLSAAGKLEALNAITHTTLQTIIGLMAATGLRVGEVVKLKKSDIFIEESIPRLFIRPNKQHRCRWVPLHMSTVSHLRAYLEHREALHEKLRRCESLFVSNRAKPINRISLYGIFQRLMPVINACPRIGQARPTLHSLRHTFAVRRLQKWYEENEDVYGLLANISVYLGHADPDKSYWYLSCTPELMSTAARRFELYLEGELL